MQDCFIFFCKHASLLAHCFRGDSVSRSVEQVRKKSTPAFALVMAGAMAFIVFTLRRSEEHTSELQSLMRISYAVFCLKKKNNNKHTINYNDILTMIIQQHNKCIIHTDQLRDQQCTQPSITHLRKTN